MTGLTLADILESAGCDGRLVIAARGGMVAVKLRDLAHRLGDDEGYDICDAWRAGAELVRP